MKHDLRKRCVRHLPHSHVRGVLGHEADGDGFEHVLSRARSARIVRREKVNKVLVLRATHPCEAVAVTASTRSGEGEDHERINEQAKAHVHRA